MSDSIRDRAIDLTVADLVERIKRDDAEAIATLRQFVLRELAPPALQIGVRGTTRMDQPILPMQPLGRERDILYSVGDVVPDPFPVRCGSAIDKVVRNEATAAPFQQPNSAK